MFTDRLIVTLAFLRHGLTFGVLAEMFSVNRATIGRAVNEIRPLLSARGVDVGDGVRLLTLADVFAYLDSTGVVGRIDGTEIQVRRPRANKPGRRQYVSGKPRQNTMKATVISDDAGRILWIGCWRPGRIHDQIAIVSEGIDDLLTMYPNVRLLVDAGYRRPGFCRLGCSAHIRRGDRAWQQAPGRPSSPPGDVHTGRAWTGTGRTHRHTNLTLAAGRPRCGDHAGVTRLQGWLGNSGADGQ